ncbi:hypothetical protein Pst134EB_014155 [Puccinia striiformis f. sp. tritici]|uniref:Mitochondrial adapter protein MCP1 transmembrane domain-containing protein n=1 Tax=Puccinia striiformis f. sp. tritici PST-78 TaxID=1165861 RepID=A0A0L0VS59_9BASI|nr:hypothetical protein Pst134EB_014155 [Puccinia striiformis f. sp. tritici]KNF02037.1 hypothetical protein PSTG_04857 [Puccinia striiformis f. sp. tritici PST-78]
MQLDRILELTQDLSGLAFSSFLFIHLASPIGAAIVGRAGNSESVASSVQLAGRVVYRDGRLREALLVWIPLGTHLIVGFVRRVTRINRQRRIRAQLELRAQLAEGQPPTGRRARTTHRQPTSQWLKSYLPTTSHAIAGYIAIPFLLDHIFSHRLSASPSLRSFQFVGFNLQDSPFFASIKYACLLSTSLYHSLVGIDQVFSRLSNSSNPPKRKSIPDSQRSLSVCLGWLGIVGTVGFGIRKIAREPIPPWMARRYQ